MRRVFSLQSLPVSRWRNGGGETREIIRFPPDAADFAWRASIATIACDGPFSTFNGVDRTITLLNGSPVLLHGATCEHRLLPEAPGLSRVNGRWRPVCKATSRVRILT